MVFGIVSFVLWNLSYFIVLGLFIVFLVLYLKEKQKCSGLFSGFSENALVPVDNPSPTNPKSHSGKFQVAHDIEATLATARSNFVLRRYNYSNGEQPLVTMVTRTLVDGEEMRRNVLFAKHMSDNNFEHVVLRDTKGQGMKVAEAALCAFRKEYKGAYICHVDDDDYVYPSFVGAVAKVIQEHNPKVIVFRVWHEPSNQMMPLAWKEFPVEGSICTNNVLIHHSLYEKLENSGVVAQDHAGDFALIHNVLLDCSPSDVYWLDECFMTVTKTRTFELSPKTDGYVTAKLNGGLGNQLFQVGTALSYARKHNKSLWYDTSKTKVGEGSDIVRHTYFDTALRWVDGVGNPTFWNTFKESSFSHESPPGMVGNVELEGYFQGLRYVKDVRDEMRTLVVPSIGGYRDLSGLGPTVAMHVRRTDYVGSDFHFNLGSDYYHLALMSIRKSLGKKKPLHVVVFSDDLEWCRSHAQALGLTSKRITYEFADSGSDVKDMAWMSSCDHRIMANSSFSWWSWFLSQSDNEIVVAPKKWFGSDTMDWSDLYEPSWTLL